MHVPWGFLRALDTGPCTAELIRADVQDVPGLSRHPCACCPALENPQGR